MNDLFSELYDAYMNQVQRAKRRNEKVPNMLFSLRPEHLAVLLSIEGAHHYMSPVPIRAIFGVPFVENGDQLSTWNLHILVDRGASIPPDHDGHNHE